MGASDEMVRLAKEYGHHLGLAFQLVDDLLDDGTEVSLVSEKGREYVVTLLNEETEKATNCAKTLGESELLTAFATNLLKRTK
jgi:geranylgeranyl pyrophosphate synthase